jgi:drug/metabolite transporter (DMT)-like permease
MAQFKHYLLLHLVVLIWGFTAVLGLLISIPAVEIVFYRTLIASSTLAVVLLIGKKSWVLPRTTAIAILGTGALIAAHWILFFAAARVANASVCLAGMATCSLWTSLLEPWMTGRKIRIYEVGLGLLVIVGLYVIFRFEFDHALGLSMAIASAVLGAVFTILNARFAQHHDAYVITFYEMTGACLSVALFLPIYVAYLSEAGTLLLVPTLSDWGYLLVLALVCTLYAFSVSVQLMRYVTAFAMNLTNNLEPVYGILLAVLIFGEKETMSLPFYVGTAIILLSVLAYPVIRRVQRRRALSPELIS